MRSSEERVCSGPEKNGLGWALSVNSVFIPCCSEGVRSGYAMTNTDRVIRATYGVKYVEVSVQWVVVLGAGLFT